MIQLSVIIPHYNSLNSLIRLMKTIPLSGLRNEYEVLIVDDKSNDEVINSLEEKFKNKYDNVFVFRNENKSKGAGVCRNIGMTKARGKYILFVDADDLMIEGFWESIEKYFNSNEDVIFFAPTSINIYDNSKSNRHKLYKSLVWNYYENPNELNELSLRYKFHVPWSKLIRLEFLKENNILFDEVKASNDVMFSTKLGHFMKRFKVSTETIYCVTKGKGTLTSTYSEEILNCRINVFITYYTFLKSKLDKSKFLSLGIDGINLLILSNKVSRINFFKTLFILMKYKIPIISIRKLNLQKIKQKILN